MSYTVAQRKKADRQLIYSFASSNTIIKTVTIPRTNNKKQTICLIFFLFFVFFSFKKRIWLECEFLVLLWWGFLGLV